jgi:hypothetical protein
MSGSSPATKVVIAMPELETALRSLTRRADLFPPTPDIAAGIAAQHGPARSPRRFDLRLVAIVALIVLAALAAALTIPSTRGAIADFFGIEGIRIEHGGEGERQLGTPTAIGGTLLLGERSTLDDARAAAPFAIVLPADAESGPPDEVWLNQRGGATVVGLIWQASGELPEIGDTGVGMLLLEIVTDDDDAIFIKKMIGGGEMDTVDVGGRTGIWIEGGALAAEPVEGLMLDLFDPAMRRSGNVLIWSDGGVTYRLETALPQADAVRIAASLTPETGAVGP